MKRILLLLLIMLLLGLTACDNIGLEDYKEAKRVALQQYADDRIADGNYCKYGVVKIRNAITVGKEAITDATTKSAVTKSFNNTKAVIDVVEESVWIGKFYTLQEAFDIGLLAVEDLQAIAILYNNNADPADTLDCVDAKSLKKSYRKNVIGMSSASLDGIIIRKYYGTYNGNIAVDITDEYHKYDYVVFDELTIEGVIFYSIHIASILILSSITK